VSAARRRPAYHPDSPSTYRKVAIPMTERSTVDVNALAPAAAGPGALDGLRVLDLATMMAALRGRAAPPSYLPKSLLVNDHAAGSAWRDGLGLPQRGGGGLPVSSRVRRRVMMVTVAHHTMASWCSGLRS
jgi:hypothetical protein